MQEIFLIVFTSPAFRICHFDDMSRVDEGFSTSYVRFWTDNITREAIIQLAIKT